jgi:hypothetical protein
MTHRHRTTTTFISIGALAFVGGCAAAAPTERLEGTAGAIRSAEEVGAKKVPQAALHLQLAREQSDHAKDLIASGEKVAAASLLLRAQADAELAVALVRADEDRTAAVAAVERVKSLQESNR